MRILKELKYEFAVFALFLLSRLPGLGHEIFNTDVWKWKTRIFDFGSGVFGLDFPQTLQTYHPGVTLMWLGSLGVKLQSFYYKIILKSPLSSDELHTIFELHRLQKLVIVVAVGITLCFAVYALRKQFSPKYAVVFALLVIFEPFFVALTRVIHLEGLMSIFMLTSFIWLYWYLSDTTVKKRLVLSAFFSGLAILTKTAALFMLPFTFALLFMLLYRNEKVILKVLKTSVKHFLSWVVVCVLTCFLLWPALWVTPLVVVQALYAGIFETGVEGGHEQLFFGKLVDDPGIFFYPVVFLFKSSVYLLVGLIGYVVFARKQMTKEIRDFVFFVLLFSLTYAFFMAIPSKKLDRYLLPSILSLLLIAGFFFNWVLAKTKHFYLWLVVLMLPAGLMLARLHPDYFAYYNPLVGGLKVGITVLEPKWIIGQHEIVKYLADLKAREGFESFTQGDGFDELLHTSKLDNKLVVGFPEKYYTQIWPFVREIGAWATISDLTAHAKESKYFVYPVWADASVGENRFKIEYVDDIKLHGVVVYKVYRLVEN